MLCMCRMHDAVQKYWPYCSKVCQDFWTKGTGKK